MSKPTAYLIALIFFLAWPAAAGHHHPEAWYQARWCWAQGGQVEVVLPDRTRCDCITANHAIEVDFAGKWAEAIGQALYYSLQTHRRAGVALIIESESDRRHWIRLNSTINHHRLPVDTWEVKNVWP